LIQFGDIGDVVLTFPAVRALKEHFWGARIVVAVREKARELMEDLPWADGVISVSKTKRGLWKELAYEKQFFSRLRAFHFDLAVDMRTGSRGAILAFLSGAPLRMAFYAQDGKLWRNRVFNRLVSLQGRPGQHISEYYLSLVRAYGVQTDRVWPELPVPLDKQRRAEGLFQELGISSQAPVVAVQPFSLWKYKEWRPERYAALIDWVDSEYGLPVVVIGSPDERERAEALVRACGQKAYNLAGKTSLGVLAAVFKRSAFFIGGDSAGMHIAAAVGTPTVNILGPSAAWAWAPRGEGHRVIQKDWPCVPCSQKGCEGTGVSRCLEELTVEEVMSVVRAQADKIGTPREVRKSSGLEK